MKVPYIEDRVKEPEAGFFFGRISGAGAGNRAFRLYLLPAGRAKGYRCNPLRESKPLQRF
jgi:hypothetical protein